MNLFKNNSNAAQKRNLGSKRCVRFSISINNEYDRKLSRLSTSCGMSKSEMTGPAFKNCIRLIECNRMATGGI